MLKLTDTKSFKLIYIFAKIHLKVIVFIASNDKINLFHNHYLNVKSSVLILQVQYFYDQTSDKYGLLLLILAVTWKLDDD